MRVFTKLLLGLPYKKSVEVRIQIIGFGLILPNSKRKMGPA